MFNPELSKNLYYRDCLIKRLSLFLRCSDSRNADLHIRIAKTHAAKDTAHKFKSPDWKPRAGSDSVTPEG